MEVELKRYVTPHLQPAYRWPDNHDPVQPSAGPDSLAKQNAASGGSTLEPRITELETRFEYIHRDLGEVRSDVKSIRARLAYMAGGATLLGTLVAWVANTRLDQIMLLLTS
ncbi:hypothetical protein ACMGT0_10445 [Pseudomonas sp. RHF3.3-3]|uniref:hypothetical protein n=1 Tax=Pseudomonas sp. RHF3.3-3 TaxID=3396624 RepID=UPI003A8970AF